MMKEGILKSKESTKGCYVIDSMGIIKYTFDINTADNVLKPGDYYLDKIGRRKCFDPLVDDIQWPHTTWNQRIFK